MPLMMNDFYNTQNLANQAKLNQYKMNALEAEMNAFKEMQANMNNKPVEAAAPTIIPATKPQAPATIPETTSDTGETKVLGKDNQWMSPASLATSLAPTETTSPTGTTMPSFMGGAKAEEKAKTALEGYTQPEVKPAEAKDVAPVTNTGKLNQAVQVRDRKQQAVDDAYTLADNLRRKGDLLAYRSALKSAQDLETELADAKVKTLKAADATMEHQASIAFGVKKVFDAYPNDSVAQERAWQAGIMQLTQDTGQAHPELQAITDPNERKQFLERAINQATSVKDQIKLQIEAQKYALKVKTQDDLNNYRSQRIALDQNKQVLLQQTLDDNKAKTLLGSYDSAINNLNSNIVKANGDLNQSFDSEIKAQIEANIRLMQAERDSYITAKNDALTSFKDAGKARNKPFVYAPGEGAIATKTEPTPTKEAAPTKVTNLDAETKEALKYYNSPGATPQQKEDVKRLYKQKTGKDLPTEGNAKPADKKQEPTPPVTSTEESNGWIPPKETPKVSEWDSWTRPMNMLRQDPEQMKQIIISARENNTKLPADILKVAKYLEKETPGIFDKGVTGNRNTSWLKQQ